MEYDDDDQIYDCSDDCDIEESDDPDQPPEKDYTVFSEAEVRKFQEKDVSDLSNLLSITKSQSIFVLCHYKWDVNKVHEDWFANEEKVRNSVGLFERPIRKISRHNITCKICFDRFPRDDMSAASCRRHLYCHECWRGYIGESIYNGLGCLMLRCPDTSCIASVDQSMVNAFGSDEDKEKYYRYLLQSYIECSKMIKWCPSPGCDLLVKLDQCTSNYDVACKCTNVFCWNCNEDAHRPVICETVAAWIQKNNSESENVTWIIANSKPCPRCKKPIEKNQGCMHMTCRKPCGHQFCWICLGPWFNHDSNACNRYKVSQEKGLLNEDDIKRTMAKNAIRKYTHYYERWASNIKSMKKAQADLQDMRTNKLDELETKLKAEGESLNVTDLEFITKAWEQIVDCRRILAWTYAYGYYLPENETAKKNFFEFSQGEAETGLERLHKGVEKDLEQIIALKDFYDRRRSFNEFRRKLVGLTRVTNKYFDDLVRALENGLEEVKSQWSIKTGGVVTEADFENWMCSRCTYENGSSDSVCQVCAHPR